MLLIVYSLSHSYLPYLLTHCTNIMRGGNKELAKGNHGRKEALDQNPSILLRESSKKSRIYNTKSIYIYTTA